MALHRKVAVVEGRYHMDNIFERLASIQLAIHGPA